jgi:amino acid adenylation domain-containing protein
VKIAGENPSFDHGLQVAEPAGELRPHDATLASEFDAICARYPDHNAVTCDAESITYHELSLAADRVAASLCSLELPANALVAIYLDRSIEMVVAMLGVIKAGAAYLPLDPTYPEARIQQTLDDAEPAVILTDAKRAAALRQEFDQVVCIDDLLLAPAYPTHDFEPAPANPDALAYVIYTSGSTGQPKGVMVSHHNVIRLLEQTAHWFNFTDRDVWTMFHSFAFDFSVWEIWGCLLTGGRLVIVPYTVSRSPEDFYALLTAEHVTVLNQTPTAFSLLMQTESRLKPQQLSLRFVIFGGEALNLRSLLPWFNRHGDNHPQLINMYGITETTVHVTYRRVLSGDALTETESLIGEPIPDLEIHLLGSNLQPVAPGETGEICVGGFGVALGYLNRPELTAERFIADPLHAGGRLYRSGDLARRRADGELVYLGRADRQIKINGFRIELGEIESTLVSFPGSSQACVVPYIDPTAGQCLVAYFVAAPYVEPVALRAFAAQQLPAHMRPTFYVRMESLPLNANGKVDRDALPPPNAPRPQTRTAAPARALTLEDRIAACWHRILQTNTIGLNDNFFDVGGSSLLLAALRNELQTALDRTIPVTWLFEYATIRSFAAKLAADSQEKAPLQLAAQHKLTQQRDSFARMRQLKGGAR